MSTEKKSSIRVAGDSTIDWRVTLPDVVALDALQAAYQWDLGTAPGISPEAGGASLLTHLLRHTIADSAAVISGPDLPDAALRDPNDPRWTRTFNLWRPHPAVFGNPELAWRLDRFWGIRPATVESQAPEAPAPAQFTDCLVLDDAGFGFRARRGLWPVELTSPALHPAHVLHKIAGALEPNELWTQLATAHADRLTTYVAAGDLRKDFAAIGQPHSWQRTAEDVVAAIQVHPALNRAQRVVVSLGMAGVVFLERGADPLLVFDPLHQEGDWERERPGMTMGLGTCMVAALTLTVVEHPAAPNWPDAIARGLLAARRVHEHGYDFVQETGALSFPVAQAAAALREPAGAFAGFSSAAIRPGHDWLMPADKPDELRELARQMVFDGGAAAHHGFPVERMGAWVSVDRTEIESVRSVRLIVNQYLHHDHRQRPLNLAVFGPPGSGKSFAVKQMAKEWRAGGARIEILEFNVAQFTSNADLATALQRVRDATVEQALPLVFWDEFDASFDGRELGWLARFLAPMQDGLFFEGGITRPIGPAIFVFAGGAHPTLASFKHRAVTTPGAKATDFLSRLRGHIDVLGPNQRDANDHAFGLRRALLLRSQLLGSAPHLAPNGHPSIDPGVLRAFLEVPDYVHGARSMEAIIHMSGLTGRLRYERSALPAAHQLSLHVDAAAFLALVNQEPVAP